jgi:methylmalonyl-CoA/ethylmalonyl-CoA epimerase
MPEVKRIHHVAVLVADLDDSLHFWHDLLGIAPSKVSEIPAEAARIAFLPLGETQIELVQPAMQDSGLSRFLARHGPGLHHLCLQVDDLADFLEQLKSKGVQLVNDQPKVGEDGRLYAFIHPKSTRGVLLELYQLQK